MNVHLFDLKALKFLRKISEPLARWGLFIAYVWFGSLKVFGLSPATPLVRALYDQTISSVIDFNTFFILFGIFEILIGLLFVVRGMERVVFPLLLLHMITTFLPLIFVSHMAWTGFMVPTLEGQYILKNIALIACGVGIIAHLHPLRD